MNVFTLEAEYEWDIDDCASKAISIFLFLNVSTYCAQYSRYLPEASTRKSSHVERSARSCFRLVDVVWPRECKDSSTYLREPSPRMHAVNKLGLDTLLCHLHSLIGGWGYTLMRASVLPIVSDKVGVVVT
jgi:hypothetical protein